MTRIDFYVLPDDTEQQRIHMVCKLTEKAVRQAKNVFIHTDNQAAAESVDSALWYFREDSFIPHRTLHDSAPDSVSSQESIGTSAGFWPEPVDIGYGLQPDQRHSVLINLATDVPPFFSRFERALEIVNQQEAVRSTGRVRYSFYQQRGYPLQHHKI